MSNDSDIKREIAVRLTVLARLLRNDFDRQVSGLNATRSQWSLIAAVARRPGVTQRTIADALEISEASAGRLIDKLCADGLLTRRAREDDRRAREVYLTEAAEPLVARLAEVAKSSEERVFRGFSDHDLEMLLSYMEQLYANLTDTPGCP